jgi:ATP-dependent Clp protease adapter protein ClpS
VQLEIIQVDSQSKVAVMALILLLGIFAVIPAGLFFVLRWIARRWLRNRPAHPYAAKITPWGFLVYTGMTLVLLYACVIYQLRPDSAVGAVLHKPGGVVIGLAVMVLAASCVEMFLRSTGRPTSIPLAGSGVGSSSVLLSPETPLLTLPDFVPAGFKCGVEVLNDDATPMEFVVRMLSAHLGLGRKDAIRTMLGIHTKGGALLATATPLAAETAARAITTEASNRGYPLVCRAVSVA